MNKVTNVVDKLVQFKDKSDGTYDFNTLESVEYDAGYQVTFVRPEAFKILNKDQWDLITNYFCNILNSDIYVGVYQGTSEVSFHCIPKDKAIEIMQEYNQECIMDWFEKSNNPSDSTSWFIMNRTFDDKKLVNYDEIIRKIQ